MAGFAEGVAPRMMAIHGCLAVLVFCAGPFLPHPLAGVHLVLAAGVMPLILAAMLYFVPVLTRGRVASPAMGLVPVVALAGGAMAVAGFLGRSGAPLLFTAAAAAALAAVIALAAWALWRAADCVGRPHPCLDWYLAALGCLGIALGAVLLIHEWADHYYAIRRLHLHLNTLGFVGLTAFGTLQVLMPTAAGAPDGSAADRLKSDWPWALAGTLIAAVAAGWWPEAGWVGAVLWAVPVARAFLAWKNRFTGCIFRWHGAPPLLAAGFAGFVLSLGLGVLHGAALLDARGAVTLFMTVFLFPLVAGALTHLLPVWVSGDEIRRTEARARLGRFNGALALVFPASGLLWAVEPVPGLAAAGAGIAFFALKLLVVVVSALRR